MMETDSNKAVYGKEVLAELAKVYPQLYLDPEQPESAEAYQNIVLRGQEAPSADLSHFIMHEEDSWEPVETRAGIVRTVTLHERRDFERFLHIMANKCVPYDVPASQGASFLDGLISWQKIRAHQKKWTAEQLEKGDLFPDWGAEFRRFTTRKENYTEALIVLSAGPYSNVPAETFGLQEEEWNRRSSVIRKYHECTHFMCRRLFPEQIDAVWDEAAADAAGIAAAFGTFDISMEAAFLGVGESGYTGGRLENYVGEEEDIDALAVKVYGILRKAAELYEAHPGIGPFDFVLLLEKKQQEWWNVR